MAFLIRMDPSLDPLECRAIQSINKEVEKVFGSEEISEGSKRGHYAKSAEFLGSLSHTQGSVSLSVASHICL